MRAVGSLAPVRLAVIVLVRVLLSIAERVLARGRRRGRVGVAATARAVDLRVDDDVTTVERTASTHTEHVLRSLRFGTVVAGSHS